MASSSNGRVLCVLLCVTLYSDLVFTIAFTIEAVLKVVAFGFKPYMSFFHNQVDILIVVSSLVMLFLDSLTDLHVIKVSGVHAVEQMQRLGLSAHCNTPAASILSNQQALILPGAIPSLCLHLESLLCHTCRGSVCCVPSSRCAL